jgi:hypothetical protein
MPGEDLTFWRGIFRDHAVFIGANLGPDERPEVERAHALREQFERLAGDRLLEGTIGGARELIAFTRHLLQRLLACQLTIHLHASVLSEMIEEEEEFLREVGVLPRPATTFARLLHHHRLWLEDAALHCSMVLASLDPSEHLLREQFAQYEHALGKLCDQARHQSEAYEQTDQQFAAAKGLTREAMRWVGAHVKALERLETLIDRCEVVISAPSLLPNHMIREESRYLRQVAMMASELG